MYLLDIKDIKKKKFIVDRSRNPRQLVFLTMCIINKDISDLRFSPIGLHSWENHYSIWQDTCFNQTKNLDDKIYGVDCMKHWDEHWLRQRYHFENKRRGQQLKT